MEQEVRGVEWLAFETYGSARLLTKSYLKI